jgi:sugar/nucleoside kinase (ribokinase family)
VSVVVVGVANVQQTIPVARFPLSYSPVHYATHELRLEASGVGFNVARTLKALGAEVSLATLVGNDPAGLLVRAELDRAGLPRDGVVDAPATPTSAVLVDRSGARHVRTDLKDLLEATYPPEVFGRLLRGAVLAVISTIGFARPLLDVARRAGVPIATDLQTVATLDDPYPRPWLSVADVVFCSGEQLAAPPEEFAAAALARFPARIVVVGLGADGALLAVRDRPARRLAAVAPHGVVDTTGAGDALFAGFLDAWLATGDPDLAAARAIMIAGCAVGTPGAGTHVTVDHVTRLAAARRAPGAR